MLGWTSAAVVTCTGPAWSTATGGAGQRSPVRKQGAEAARRAVRLHAPAGASSSSTSSATISSLAVGRPAPRLGGRPPAGSPPSRAAGCFASDQRILTSATPRPDRATARMHSCRGPSRHPLEAARALVAARHVVACATAPTPPRAVLLEPAGHSQAAVDLSDWRWLDCSPARGVTIARSGAAAPAGREPGPPASTAPPPASSSAENRQVGSWPPGYRRPSTRPGPSRSPTGSALLEGDETYACAVGVNVFSPFSPTHANADEHDVVAWVDERGCTSFRRNARLSPPIDT